MFTGRWCGGTAAIDWPSMEISPDVGTSNPANIRSRVVLPHPEGPRSEKNSPRPMSRDTLSTARTAPKVLLTSAIEMIGSPGDMVTLSPRSWSEGPKVRSQWAKNTRPE